MLEAQDKNLVEISFANELKDGELKSLKVGQADDQKVLISRYNGNLYATGNFCSHFGVPLENGLLFDDKVRCPAHAAAFNVTTGEPERQVGMDGIPSFPVVNRDGKYFDPDYEFDYYRIDSVGNLIVSEDGYRRTRFMPLSKGLQTHRYPDCY